jgi:hypothetical protein
MCGRWWLILLALIAVASRGAAQAMPHPELPPVVPLDVVALPGGLEVSRPLTPVEIPPVVVAPKPVVGEPVGPSAVPVQRVEELQQVAPTLRGPLGPRWDALELLIWWPKAAPLPPLVTATRSGALPSLGDPGTEVVVGGRALANPDIAGGRFVLGRALNTRQTLGLEAVYFFLGSRTDSVILSDAATPRIRTLGLPYVDERTGAEQVFPLALPGVARGSVFVSTTTRAQGVEANLVANLADTSRVRLNGLMGYRYLQINEGLTIEQFRTSPGGFGPIYDQFDGHNRFHGGQVGLSLDLSQASLYCELTGKVAFGQSTEVVKIDGATTIYTPTLGGATVADFPGGVYALLSNMGRYTRTGFAVVPEAMVKLGVKISDTGRVYIGYQFLYLSSAVRPGEQIDRMLNPAQIAAWNPAGSFFAQDRPRVPFARSDYWLQGLTIGLETRY